MKKRTGTKRLNTKLESEGAEFLVLGQLLLHKIPTYKTYTNMPGYDLVSVNPEKNTSAKVQVKSRWKTDATGFLIKKLECDFVTVVLLNRGSKDGKKKVLPPEFYVFPIELIKKVIRKEKWSKVNLKDIKNIVKYKENWLLISKFLDRRNARARSKNR